MLLINFTSDLVITFIKMFYIPFLCVWKSIAGEPTWNPSDSIICDDDPGDTQDSSITEQSFIKIIR